MTGGAPTLPIRKDERMTETHGPAGDDLFASAVSWVAEVNAAYADGGYAAGDGPNPPLDEMEWLLDEYRRLHAQTEDGCVVDSCGEPTQYAGAYRLGDRRIILSFCERHFDESHDHALDFDR